MPLNDDARAAIAKMTADLVSSYCQTLEIGASDLPGLIAYVGHVLTRSAGEPQRGVLPCVRDRADAPCETDAALVGAPIIVGRQAVIIDLEAYRARR